VITGPDISSNNPHPIDWPTLAASGQTFVIIKAGGDQTGSDTYRNPYFPDDYQQARAAGLVVGAYHWVSNADPTPTVAAVKALWQPGDLPVALDFEQAGITHQRLHQVRAAYRMVGLATMTYTYPAFWTQMGDPSCTECAADPLWYAAYQSKQPSAPAPWRNVTFWQYAGTSVELPGIRGLNDMSRFIGTNQQFAALCGRLEEDDVAQWWHDTDGTEWALDAVAKRRLTSPAQRADLQNVGLLSKTRRDVTTDVDRARLAQTPEVK